MYYIKNIIIHVDVSDVYASFTWSQYFNCYRHACAVLAAYRDCITYFSVTDYLTEVRRTKNNQTLSILFIVYHL